MPPTSIYGPVSRAKVQQLASKEAMGDDAPSHKDMNVVDETTEKAKAMIQV